MARMRWGCEMDHALVYTELAPPRPDLRKKSSKYPTWGNRRTAEQIGRSIFWQALNTDKAKQIETALRPIIETAPLDG